MARLKREHCASIHLDKELWRRIERLAAEERRPISQLLRNIVADHIGAYGRAKTAAAGDQEAAA